MNIILLMQGYPYIIVLSKQLIVFKALCIRNNLWQTFVDIIQDELKDLLNPYCIFHYPIHLVFSIFSYMLLIFSWFLFVPYELFEIMIIQSLTFNFFQKNLSNFSKIFLLISLQSQTIQEIIQNSSLLIDCFTTKRLFYCLRFQLIQINCKEPIKINNEYIILTILFTAINQFAQYSDWLYMNIFVCYIQFSVTS
ncbi:unnamed protein product (macronuclear) [Paramecium tetraurelia]|uniref:Transmembrane protein n=1 Tax=Paramecium tetraurelia TaxID=5888 RepID=A0DPT4_PARTE|nr:uncharacterized protein GSPATT00019233001 [Paramecium tetraurelia]CAK85051.1 unnamed protein product [Paramecium tetraurelia]|eukprot:XP_001452448.1 hypothetical protein (macronuclear) [Paramecium tetraurelia strain d4-2]